jgi:hypothetical protein
MAQLLDLKAIKIPIQTKITLIRIIEIILIHKKDLIHLVLIKFNH